MSEAPDILQLPEDLQNKIAAGEVIERPAAVVKELIENSIDAGATRITVAIEQGGKRLMEVVDDGHGIRADRLELALSRHATSKLRTADDLAAIATLGFRGEALSSIAGVSEMELASSTGAAAGGAVIRLQGGRLLAREPVAQPRGSRVTVRNLFWNVPARLKFLKSDAAEAGHIGDMLQRFALGHPGIAFALTNNGRQTLDLPLHRSMADRIRACCGKELATGLIGVAGDRPSAQLSGFIGHPGQAKPSARQQFVYLNGRYIRDKLLVAAIRAGFEGRLEPRLHPVVFLHLDIDPALVDVNVHPTKAEVRFRNSGEVFTLVRDALRHTLAEQEGDFALLGGGFADHSPVVSRTVVKAPGEPAIQERFLPRPDPWAPPPPGRVAEAEPGYPAPSASDGLGVGSDTVGATAAQVPSEVRQVVQLRETYLLVETDAGIRIIDQHALHEKALWLSLDPEADGLITGGRQELLVPISVELSAAEVAAVEPLLEDLAACGIQAERFGPTGLLVRAHPARLRRLDWERFFAGLAQTGDAPAGVAAIQGRLAHRLACTAAVKAGDRLEPEEQRELVALLYRCEDLRHCPHGRPTTLDLSWAELERRFQR